MLSYLCNRHYHSMTQLLPEPFRQNQPEVLYYKTFIDEPTLTMLRVNQKINHRNMSRKNSPLKRSNAMKYSQSKKTD